MNRLKHMIPLLAAAGLFSALSPVTSFARDRIEKVSLTFSLDEENWETVDVDCGDDTYSVREVSLYPTGMGNSTYPCAVVILDADDDYYFSSIRSNYFELEGEGASFGEASRSNSNSTMTVSVRLKDLGEGEMDPPTSLIWTDSGIACWDPVDGAASYSVRIRRDGEAVGITSAKTDITFYNLSTKITRPGEYVFQVRANGPYQKTKSSEWVSSPVLYVDQEKLDYIQANAAEDTGVAGQWIHDINGYMYRYANGVMPSSQWCFIDNYWYYFNEYGYKLTDQWVGNYYVGSDGSMLTNTLTPDGNYVDENGCWAPYHPQENQKGSK